MTSHANPSSLLGSSVKTLSAVLPAGTTIHAWLKAARAETLAELRASQEGREIGRMITHNSEEFEFQALVLEAGGETALAYDAAATAVSVVYAFSNDDVLEKGIHVLYGSEENAAPAVPGSYHFRPPFGWMNDPNGFGRFADNVHLFYQHYPHSLRWNTMHWGHAVSDDYLHWRHLPIFLLPSAELSARPDGRGGAFSGSAIPLAGEKPGIRVFFTEQVKDRLPEEQIQLTAVTGDQISAGPAEIILPARPAGLDLTMDFRDPYVLRGPDGRWKMLLGSRDHAGGVILLYETADPDAAGGWIFVGILHRENRFGMTAAECPCIVPLDGSADDPQTRWALIFGLLTSRDPATGRRNITIATVGRFDGRNFVKEFEQELDFGTDAYAFQAFVDQSAPVGIAWLANWTEISKKIDFPTAMTLPRRVLIRNGALLTPPIEAVDTLRQQLVDENRLLAGETVKLGNGAVEMIIDLAADGAAFDLEFDHPDVELGLRLDPEGLSILYDVPDGKWLPRYIAAGARPSTLRIFLDKGSIEVFADNGRWTGTKRLPGFEGVRSARLSAPAGNVAIARIWQLKL
ncbi:beta-fructofuranosidase [Sinorhizobium fredii USDA 205]|uniref:beta-fructofuranosidase n=1 Tax=Rhizobium fredii TaxID=380 RepID=A0A844A822_RHIFR|nr:GH32 C-terminal domain-containing protein [Sinorhizobium fredii]ASY72131.1 Sucrose-6-phosphate hydrolase [Sinorhizobium fredii CCBAU 83666]KSV84259.1 beta-fructofuranosidase [Sinorhizobium fredii USDA 205]MQX08182.1 glycoside hydrolase family 32 protein [Sinorhizobium fredii]GEC30779.1 beta-fructofuranosidase [Sinorhizobium fredii]GLS10330.1 beta-fructofuranosidase [Sinorhizobium fredii]